MPCIVLLTAVSSAIQDADNSVQEPCMLLMSCVM
jgi:hypothetical protein